MNDVTVSLHSLRMHPDDSGDEEVVVIVKRSKMVFEAHKEDFYRDKASKRHGY